jgi:hypothetical protein
MFDKLNRSFSRFFLAALLIMAGSAFAQSPATVIFKSGDAVVVHADKSVASISKNDGINAGDTIETRNGRVQLSFVDGGKVSLQPQTIYRVNRYEFSGNEDGSEYAITELIKGGLRTITGVIGHKNRERYQLRTPVATIGIRGTEFTVVYNNTKLLMTTNHGSVDVCNAGGCLNAVTGQTITTINNNATPQYTSEIAKVTSAPPSAYKPVFIQAEQLNENRVSEVVEASVAEAATQTATQLLDASASLPNETTQVVTTGASAVAITTRTVIDNSGPTPVEVVVPVATEALTLGEVSNTTGTTDMLLTGVSKDANRTYYNFALEDGNIEANANSNLSNYTLDSNDFMIVRSGYNDSYSDAFVEMGSARGKINGANVNIMSFIQGDFTTSANLSNLASLSTPFTYNVIASTSPVVTNAAGRVINIGESNSVTGNMAVNFANLAYSYNLVVPVSVLNYNLAGTGALSAGSPTFADNGTISSNLGNVGCLLGCTGILKDANGNVATVSGAFFGTQADRAGLQYGIGAGANAISGSVVLAK